MALATVSPAAAQTDLVYEPFDYAAHADVDGLAATGRNLSGRYVTSSQQDLTIGSPGLSYGSLSGSLPTVSGNMLSDASLGGPGFVTVDVDHDVLIGPDEGIYFSALFRFDDTGNRVPYATVTFIDTTTGAELGFGERVVGSRAVSVFASTGVTAGIVAAGADGAFVDGQTLWLLGRYLNGSAAGSDSLALIGYDTASLAAIPAGFDPLDPQAVFSYSLNGVDIDFERISSIRFELRGAGNNFIDELRITPAFATAVPEPSTVALMLGGLTLAWLRRKVGHRACGCTVAAASRP
jgi:hypothetical protein